MTTKTSDMNATSNPAASAIMRMIALMNDRLAAAKAAEADAGVLRDEPKCVTDFRQYRACGVVAGLEDSIQEAWNLYYEAIA
jgi:hypothetical protein